MSRSGSELSDADTNCTEPEGICVGEPLLLWDWDDTLFCTSHLAKLRVSVTEEKLAISEDLRSELSQYAQTVEETLRVARRLGRVVIVTNAESGWVELTCSRFMPDLYQNVVQYLPIISARSCYETANIRSPVDWKRLAVTKLIKELENVHVVSFGDSSHEREALMQTSQQMNLLSACRIKSLKLIERPDLAALNKQHLLIQQCLIQIIDHPLSLDLCIQSIPTSDSRN